MTDNSPMSLLASRYASAAMREIFAPEAKIIAERKLWIAVMRAQSTLGHAISKDVITDYENVITQVDLASIDAREKQSRHDVKARIEEFNALAGHEAIHAGMTSRDGFWPILPVGEDRCWSNTKRHNHGVQRRQ